MFLFWVLLYFLLGTPHKKFHVTRANLCEKKITKSHPQRYEIMNQCQMQLMEFHWVLCKKEYVGRWVYFFLLILFIWIDFIEPAKMRLQKEEKCFLSELKIKMSMKFFISWKTKCLSISLALLFDNNGTEKFCAMFNSQYS